RGGATRFWMSWDSVHKYIWTHYEISVAEALRGPAERSFVVSEPGGSLDGVRMQTSGTVPYSVGEDVVLFVYRTPIGFWRVFGGPRRAALLGPTRLPQASSLRECGGWLPPIRIARARDESRP